MSEKVGLKVGMLTKKVNNKRVMRSLPDWKCVNKTTPKGWFKKYEGFITELSFELGFTGVSSTEIEDIGDSLYMTIDLYHEEGEKVFTFHLIRGHEFIGGGVSFKSVESVPVLMTACPTPNGFVESRTDVGDWIICQIRDHWDLA